MQRRDQEDEGGDRGDDHLPIVEEKSSSPEQLLLQQSHAAPSIFTCSQNLLIDAPEHDNHSHGTPLQSQQLSASDNTAAQNVDIPPFSAHQSTPRPNIASTYPESSQQQPSQAFLSSQRSGSGSQAPSVGRIIGTPSTALGGLPRGDVGRSVMFSSAASQIQSSNATCPTPSIGTPTMHRLLDSSAAGYLPPGSQSSGSHNYTSSGSGVADLKRHDGTEGNRNVVGSFGRSGDGSRDDGGEGDGMLLSAASNDMQIEHQLAETRIWGTDINVQNCMNIFRNFIHFFGADTAEESFYRRQLYRMHITGEMLLNINCSHLHDFPATRQFYQQLQQYPQEIIPIMDRVAGEEFDVMFGEADGTRRIQVRTFGLTKSSRMRVLDPKDIDQLLCIKGMVTRCSMIIPDLKQAFFRCSICSYSTDVMIDRGRIEEPRNCAQCQTLGSMELIHNRCLFTDKQLIRLQETPDEIPAGETPHTVTLFAFDDLVDTVRPGDRIEVTGIFRAVANRPNPRMRTVKSIFKTYIDAIHFRRSDEAAMDDSDKYSDYHESQTDSAAALEEEKGEFGRGSQHPVTSESSKTQFTHERIAEIRAFATSGHSYERLVKSFAPSIWELDDVKRGLLCLLLGGSFQSRGNDLNAASNRDECEDVGEDRTVHQRGDINILLCGDPGTSKSQLLSYVHKLTPRGIYTSGKGSSAVGLTASVVRDPETNDNVLESGALVLSDNGICCIDEFDKMTDQTRAILHEAMEQQTVSIAKAGIIATLNARTSILASANPVQSRYNPRLSVVENIKLPPTLLSRFDLIYLILDKPNIDSDRKLATHLVSLYYDNENAQTQRDELFQDAQNVQPVDQSFLRDFILYARTNCNPEISIEAEEVLVRDYVEMRSLGSRGTKTITATPRQLESLIRLSQALAKMRLDSFVSVGDVHEATRLMKVATQTAATDPRTGTLDMDLISTGRTALDRDLVLKLADELRELLSTIRGQRMTVGQLRQNILRQQQSDGVGSSLSMSDVEDAVKELEAEGLLQYIERTQTAIVR